jgi:hypothetical protein
MIGGFTEEVPAVGGVPRVVIEGFLKNWNRTLERWNGRNSKKSWFWVPPIGPLRRAFILFSTFLDLRPVLAAKDLQTSIDGRLEIRISKSKTPV